MDIKKILKKIIRDFIGSSEKNAEYMFRFAKNVESAVKDTSGTFANHLYKSLDMQKLIPCENILPGKNCIKQINNTDKIKVRIVYPSGDSWNNIHTMYDAFVDDERFQTVVLVENYHKYIDIMNKTECTYMILDDYDIKIDCPDILIATYYSVSDESIAFNGCRQYVKLMIAAIPNVVMNEENTDIHFRYIMNAYQKMEPDYYLVDKLPFIGLQGYIPRQKLIQMGSPQFDEIFFQMNKTSECPSGWNKLKGKRTIMWATDHGIQGFRPTNGLTIDCYLKSLIDYFRKHEEMGLIIRPHPFLIRELTNADGFWSMTDYKQLVDYCEKSPNVVWDDTFDYCNAFNMSDGYMIDANCSMICAALALDKPICRLQRPDIDEWYIHQDLSECYYYAKNMEEITDFIEMVKKGKDSKREIRYSHSKDAYVAFDGLNGKRMKDFIVEKYIEMFPDSN